jgi:hypothetical protein
MPALFWAGIPVLALLWSQVIWGLVHYGSGRVAPWGRGRPASATDGMQSSWPA